MGWYQDIANIGQRWSHRQAATVIHTSGSATQDILIPIPANWDHFWNSVLSTGFDIRPTASDGETLLAYDVVSFNATNRTGTIRIDGANLTTDSRAFLLWVYYGNASAADASAAFVPGATETASIQLGLPSTHRVRIAPEDVGTDRPRQRAQKGIAEELYVAFDISSLLQKRAHTNAKARKYEEVFLSRVRVQLGGVDQPALFDQGKTRFIEDARNRMWILAFIKAGADDTDYTMVVEVRTRVPTETNNRVLEPRVLLRVKDQTEA